VSTTPAIKEKNFQVNDTADKFVSGVVDTADKHSVPSMISHRPRSQNFLKEPALNPEKDSRIKRPRSHISLEKSSQNYKPLEN
jgi:hypothetical protein